MSQDSREQFEAAYIAELMRVGWEEEFAKMTLERGSDGKYRSIKTDGAWWGWQASRAAVVVELPKPVSGGFGLLPDDEVCDAIKAAGVKVAP